MPEKWFAAIKRFFIRQKGELLGYALGVLAIIVVFFLPDSSPEEPRFLSHGVYCLDGRAYTRTDDAVFALLDGRGDPVTCKRMEGEEVRIR